MLRHNIAARLNLSNNEMRHPRIIELHDDAIARLRPGVANTYPDLVRYRAGFAEQLSVPESQLLMSAGSDNAYLAVLGSLARSGSRVLTQQPNYSQLFVYAEMFGLAVESVPFDAASGGFSLDGFRCGIAKLAPGDLVVVSNPNGPTGAWWTDHDLLGLARAADQRGVTFLIDEAYAAYGPGSVFGVPSLPETCVVVESMSKSFGLAGGRLAFLRVPSMDAYQRLLTWNVANPVSQLTLEMGRSLLERADEVALIRNELCEARDSISQLAQEHGHLAPPCHGNFQSIAVGSAEAGARCTAGFAGADIAVRNLARFGLPGSVRVTACAGADLAEVLRVGGKVFADV